MSVDRPTPSETPHRRRRWVRRLAGIAGLAVLLAACGADGTDDSPDAASSEDDDAAVTELAVAVASFDLAVGEDRRLMAGVFSPERQLVAYGDVEFALAHLGDDGETAGEITQTATASFLPVPGMEPAGVDEDRRPQLVEDTGSGVYAAQVDLDQPGVWGLRVTATLADGTEVTGNQRFEVQPEPLVIDAGDPAPAVENPTVDDVEAGTATPVSVDSRAQEEGAAIPDAHLHRSTVAETIDAGRPAVVAITTPVYCASRFCGPLTDVLAELAHDYEDVAEFIHLEVWEDFDEQRLNEAAAAFIQTEAGGNEPWVFLLGGDGRVVARWDNVVDVDELTDALDALEEG